MSLLCLPVWFACPLFERQFFFFFFFLFCVCLCFLFCYCVGCGFASIENLVAVSLLCPHSLCSWFLWFGYSVIRFYDFISLFYRSILRTTKEVLADLGSLLPSHSLSMFLLLFFEWATDDWIFSLYNGIVCRCVHRIRFFFVSAIFARNARLHAIGNRMHFTVKTLIILVLEC